MKCYKFVTILVRQILKAIQSFIIKVDRLLKFLSSLWVGLFDETGTCSDLTVSNNEMTRK